MTKASSMKTVRGWIHGKQLLRWSGSSLLGLSLLANSTVRAGESVDRLGRLLGVGWSDGYHACAADCYLPGENLPPRSYAADHSLYSRAHGIATRPAHSVHRQHSHHQPASHYPTSDYPGTEDMIEAGPQLTPPLPHTPAPHTFAPANPEPMYESSVEPPPKQSRPPIEQIQPPESDDLLESDDDQLLEELPPPADDSLLPYQYQRLRPAGHVARTSAELPQTRRASTEPRPTRIGGGTPKRLPMVNSFSPR